MDARNRNESAADFAEKLRAVYPVEITETVLAGVASRIVIPKRAAPNKQDRVLICLHGGGFTSDSGSVLESTTIAALTGITVIAIEYRLAPQYPFPAAVDDTVAVYRHALKEYAPKKIGVYGTSAGAVLSAQMVVVSRAGSVSLCQPFWAFFPAMSISPATETPGFSMAPAASQTSVRCFLL